ncbi:MAG: hypothetical protein FD167_1760 [bacterium]|nr:MAG: hypothetical protein FD167_1760 [bacterium]
MIFNGEIRDAKTIIGLLTTEKLLKSSSPKPYSPIEGIDNSPVL